MSELSIRNSCGKQRKFGCDRHCGECYGVEYERRCDGCACNPATDMSWCICPTCEHFGHFRPSTHRLEGSRRIEHNVYCVGLVDYVPHGGRSEKVTSWRFSKAAREGKNPDGFKCVTCDDYVKAWNRRAER